jgi:hypothetical protein
MWSKRRKEQCQKYNVEVKVPIFGQNYLRICGKLGNSEDGYGCLRYIQRRIYLNFDMVHPVVCCNNSYKLEPVKYDTCIMLKSGQGWLHVPASLEAETCSQP